MSEATDGLGDRLLEILGHVSPKSARKLSAEDAQVVVEAILDDAVAQRWVTEQMAQVSIKAAEFRNGVAMMELEPARELVAMWVGACRGLIGTGPNYSETVLTDRVDHLQNRGDKVEMGVKVAESTDKYVITVQRDAFGTMTPHEARVRAETGRDQAVRAAWRWIIAVNNGAGFDAGDLSFELEKLGFPCPEGLEEEMEEEG